MIERYKDAIATWRGPLLLGLFTAAVVWTVWYFTKTPCIMSQASACCCNPSVLASFVNLEIITKAGGAGLAVGALKGGYNTYMLNKEREARQQAERRADVERQRADEERERADAERQRADERVAAERQRADERVAAERQQLAAVHQAVLEALGRLGQQSNGGSSTGQQP